MDGLPDHFMEEYAGEFGSRRIAHFMGQPVDSSRTKEELLAIINWLADEKSQRMPGSVLIIKEGPPITEEAPALPVISPHQISAIKRATIPEFVFQAVDSLIAKEFIYSSRQASISQSSIRDEIIRLAKETKGLIIESDQIYSNKWLELEGVYEEAGWQVKYLRDTKVFSFKALS